MAKKEIININKSSLAKIFALVYGLVGFFIAMVTVLLAIINVVRQSKVVMVILFNAGVGLIVAILSALLTALVGWVVGYLVAIIYNIFSKKIGGLKVELVDIPEINKDNNQLEINNN